MALDDYGALIQSGAQLVPDLSKQLMQRAQLGVLGAQAQEYQAQAEAKRQQVARQQQFQRAIQTGDGSTSSIASIVRSFPEYADKLKASHDLQSGDQKQADLTTTSEIYSAAKSGDWDLAKKLAHQRADAEKARGFSDPSYDAALGVLDKAADGDGGSQRTVLNLLGTHIAAVTGIEHFGSVYGTLNPSDEYTMNPGDVRMKGDKMVAHSPIIVDANGAVHAWNDGAGGGLPSGAGAAAPAATDSGSAPSGFDAVVDHSLANEGGYNPADMNGSPTNFGVNWKANAKQLTAMGLTPSTFKDMTRDQAKQVYQGYWKDSGAADLPANMQAPYFDVYIRNPKAAKAMLASAKGDPAAFMDKADAYFGKLGQTPAGQKYAHAWANRDAGNRAIATGGGASADGGASAEQFPLLIPGKAPEQFKVVSGAEAQKLGLDPAATWKVNAATGEPTKVEDAPKPGSEPPAPQELDDAATQYLLTGQMPALGNGGAGLKAQILARRSELMKRYGITAEQLPGVQSQYKADSSALQQNGQLVSALQTSSHALHTNAQQVWNAHRQLVKDGFIKTNPWLSRKTLDYYAAYGDKNQQNDIRVYRDALNGFTTEYTKFMTAANGMGGSAMPSDASQQAARDLNEEGLQATPLLGHLRQVLTEATNKANGATATQRNLQSKLVNYLSQFGTRGGGTGASRPAYPVNIPAGAVQMLKSNPTPQMRQFFEQKYGPGSAKQILGK